jgi:peptidoglycan/xylan/chitin deacetylase (PgdA/CDA1 family)
VDTPDNVVYLTFDDGPDSHHDLELANILRDRGYEGMATYFMVGNNVLSYPRVTAELYDRGYAIGNHTKTHSEYSGSAEAAEIGPTQEIVYNATGRHQYPGLFRAAGGTMAQVINATCARYGLVYIWTTGDERDWVDPRISPAQMNNNFSRYLRPGYISLRHSGGTHDATVAAMHDLISNIENSGYTFGTLQADIRMSGTLASAGAQSELFPDYQLSTADGLYDNVPR